MTLTMRIACSFLHGGVGAGLYGQIDRQIVHTAPRLIVNLPKHGSEEHASFSDRFCMQTWEALPIMADGLRLRIAGYFVRAIHVHFWQNFDNDIATLNKDSVN